MFKALQLILIISIFSLCSASENKSKSGVILLGPWKAGMTPVEVQKFKQFAPYISFSNGDIETYSFPYEGKNENTQFFFDNGNLKKIGILFYEGKKIQEARKAWKKLYLQLKRKYGEVELPNTQIQSNKPVTPELLSIAAAAYVQAGGKTQMAPIKQSRSNFRYSSFVKRQIHGETLYFVTLYINQPR